jgi:hypothetical protein
LPFPHKILKKSLQNPEEILMCVSSQGDKLPP